MPECTHIDLENARLRQKMPRWKLAGTLGVSESTVARWESGEIRPDPDDVDRFAAAVGDPTLWHRWMISTEACASGLVRTVGTGTTVMAGEPGGLSG